MTKKGVKSSNDGIKLKLPTQLQHKFEQYFEANNANHKNLTRPINKNTNLVNKTLLSTAIHEMERVYKQVKASNRINNSKANETNHKEVNNTSVNDVNRDVYPLIVLHQRKNKNLEKSSDRIVIQYKQSSSFKLSPENIIHYKLSKLNKKHTDKGSKQNKKHGKLATKNNPLSTVATELNCTRHKTLLENNNCSQIYKKSKDRLNRKQDRVLVSRASAVQLEAKMKKKRHSMRHPISEQAFKLDKHNDLLNSIESNKNKDYKKCAVFAKAPQEYNKQKYPYDPDRLESSLINIAPKTIKTKTSSLRSDQNIEYACIKQSPILFPDKNVSFKKLISTKKEKKLKCKRQVKPVLTDFSPYDECKNKAAEQGKKKKKGHYVVKNSKNINLVVSASKSLKTLETLDKNFYKANLVKELSDNVLSNSAQNTKYDESKLISSQNPKLSTIFSETITGRLNDNGITTIDLSTNYPPETENLIISCAGQIKDEESPCFKLVPKKLNKKEIYDNKTLTNPSQSEDNKKSNIQTINENLSSEDRTKSKKKQHNVNIRKKPYPNICEDDLNSSPQKNKVTLFYTNQESLKVSKESLNIETGKDTKVCENSSSNNMLNVVIKQSNNPKPTKCNTHMIAMFGREEISSDKWLDSTKEEHSNLNKTQDSQECLGTNNDFLENNTQKEVDSQTDDLITKYKTPRRCRKAVTLNIHEKISMPNNGQLKNTLEGEQSQIKSDVFDESRTHVNKELKEKKDIKSTEELRTQLQETAESSEKHNVYNLFMGFLKNVDMPQISNIKRKSYSKIPGKNDKKTCEFYKIINDEISSCPMKEKLQSNGEESTHMVNFKTANDNMNIRKDGHETEKHKNMSMLKTPADEWNTETECLELKLQQLGLHRKTQFLRVIKSNSGINVRNYENSPTRKTRLNEHISTCKNDANDDDLKQVNINIASNRVKDSENHEYSSNIKTGCNLTNSKQGDLKTKFNTNKCLFEIGSNEESNLEKDLNESNYEDLSNSTISHRDNDQESINIAQTQDAENSFIKQTGKFIVVLNTVNDKTSEENEYTTKNNNDFFDNSKINYTDPYIPNHKLAKNFVVAEIGVQTDFIEPSLKVGKNNCGTLISKHDAHLSKIDGKGNEKHPINMDESIFCSDNGDKTKTHTRKSFCRIINDEDKTNKENVCTIIKPINTDFTNEKNTYMKLQNRTLSEVNETKQYPQVLEFVKSEINEKENQIIYKIDEMYQFLLYLDETLKENALIKWGKSYDRINTLGQFNNALCCLCSNCLEVINKIKSREKCNNVIQNNEIHEKYLYRSTFYNVAIDDKGQQFSNLIGADFIRERGKQLGNEKSTHKSYKEIPSNSVKISNFINKLAADTSKEIGALQISSDVPMLFPRCNYHNLSTNDQFINKTEVNLNMTDKNSSRFSELKNCTQSPINQAISSDEITNGKFMNKMEINTLRKEQFNQGYKTDVSNPFVKIVSENDPLKYDTPLQLGHEETLKDWLVAPTIHTETRQHFVQVVNEDNEDSAKTKNSKETQYLNDNIIKKSVDICLADNKQSNTYLKAERQPFFVIVPSNENLSMKVEDQSESHQKKHNFEKSKLEHDDLMNSSNVYAKEDYFDTLLMKRKIENCDAQALWWDEKSDSQNANLFKSLNDTYCCGKQQSLEGMFVNKRAEIKHTCSYCEGNNFKLRYKNEADERSNTRQCSSLNKQCTCLFCKPFYDLSREAMLASNSSRLASPLGLLPHECESETLTSSFLAPKYLRECSCIFLNDENNSICELQNIKLSNEQNLNNYKYDFFKQSKYRTNNRYQKNNVESCFAQEPKLKYKAKTVKTSPINKMNLIPNREYNSFNEFLETPNDKFDRVWPGLKKPKMLKKNIINNLWNKRRDSKLCLKDSHDRNTNRFHTYGNCIKCKSNINSSLLTHRTEDSKYSVNDSLFRELKQTNAFACLSRESGIECFRSGLKPSIALDPQDELLNKNLPSPSKESKQRTLSVFNLSKKFENTNHIKPCDSQITSNTQKNIKPIKNVKRSAKRTLPFTVREFMSEHSLSSVNSIKRSFLKKNIHSQLRIDPKSSDNDLVHVFAKSNIPEENNLSKGNDDKLDNMLSKGRLIEANNELKSNSSESYTKLVHSKSNLAEANNLVLDSNQSPIDKSTFYARGDSLSKSEMHNTELEYTKDDKMKTRK